MIPGRQSEICTVSSVFLKYRRHVCAQNRSDYFFSCSVRTGSLIQAVSKSGSLLFCPRCGTLLDLPKDGESVVICEQCQHEEPASCECK